MVTVVDTLDPIWTVSCTTKTLAEGFQKTHVQLNLNAMATETHRASFVEYFAHDPHLSQHTKRRYYPLVLAYMQWLIVHGRWDQRTHDADDYLELQSRHITAASYITLVTALEHWRKYDVEIRPGHGSRSVGTFVDAVHGAFSKNLLKQLQQKQAMLDGTQYRDLATTKPRLLEFEDWRRLALVCWKPDTQAPELLSMLFRSQCELLHLPAMCARGEALRHQLLGYVSPFTVRAEHSEESCDVQLIHLARWKDKCQTGRPIVQYISHHKNVEQDCVVALSFYLAWEMHTGKLDYWRYLLMGPDWHKEYLYRTHNEPDRAKGQKYDAMSESLKQVFSRAGVPPMLRPTHFGRHMSATLMALHNVDSDQQDLMGAWSGSQHNKRLCKYQNLCPPMSALKTLAGFRRDERFYIHAHQTAIGDQEALQLLEHLSASAHRFCIGVRDEQTRYQLIATGLYPQDYTWSAESATAELLLLVTRTLVQAQLRIPTEWEEHPIFLTPFFKNPVHKACLARLRSQTEPPPQNQSVLEVITKLQQQMSTFMATSVPTSSSSVPTSLSLSLPEPDPNDDDPTFAQLYSKWLQNRWTVSAREKRVCEYIHRRITNDKASLVAIEHELQQASYAHGRDPRSRRKTLLGRWLDSWLRNQ